MRRVLLFSHTTGYQLRAFDAAAAALGIELVFATDRCHRLDDPWQDRAVAVRFFDLDRSVRAIVDRARDLPVDGVMAVGDRPAPLAARAAEALNLPWHSAAGADASIDKRKSRTAMADAGLPSPAFSLLPAGESSGVPAAPLQFPVVLKPLGLSGSRGVIRGRASSKFVA